ncbi:hypothetical protein [Limimaricola litoreus]|uniref:PemK-like, MazF-like toxin of type II toxin-antitoxin system n=1 Tax=Limimaricola litoreus TaxID=2955316 RepID=A0A9X2FNY9_9RHOB|nr:hypothetical protein [Limimaricola litoreus]MCP1168596.1 hypothetical protein [Limimaricola litoreus]
MHSPQPACQTSHPDWRSRLCAGDIVAYRFPHERDGDEPPKVRPTLVLAIHVENGQRIATLAYGTSSGRPRAPRRLVPVTDPDELACASLRKPTVFDAARRLRVPLDDPAFEPHPVLNTAVIGQLTGAAAARLALVQRQVTRGSDRRLPWGRARPSCTPAPIKHRRNRPLLSCKPPDRRDINTQSGG